MEGQDRSARLRAALDAAAALAMIVAATAIVWLAFVVPPLLARNSSARAGRAESELPAAPVSIEGAAIKGNPAARVGVIEYSDFQCPYCATFARDTLPQIVEKYVDTGKVLFVFRHTPIEAIHPHARRAAEAAECGRRQNQFWPVHDALFASPDVFDGFDPVRLPVQGLDRVAFETCLAGQAVETVRKEMSDARALGIRGTPTFLFGIADQSGRTLRITRREAGAIPFDAFAAVLDETIEAASETARR